MPNCFEYTCPYCGGEDEIDILVNVWARLTEDGSDTDIPPSNNGHEWDDESVFQCNARGCGKTGLVGQLQGK